MKTIAAMITLCLAAAVGCGGATPSPQNTQSAGAGSPTTFAEQVALGGKLYGAQCASCHGAGGEGKGGPRVVGLTQGALPLNPPAGAKARKAQFKTVGDMAAFTVRTMPADKPGTLTAEEYWAILAFDLKANGIDLGEKKLDASLASTLTIPR